MAGSKYILTFVLLILWSLTQADSTDHDYLLQILKKNDNKNVIFSPLSINTAFGMVYIGTQGESKAQLKTGLYIDSTDDQQYLSKVANLSDVFNAHYKGYNITLANRVWAKNDFPILDNYTSTIRKKFSSDIIPVEKFGDPTVAEINQWVENKTNDKIKNILEPGSLGDTTALVLVNALYLNALWQHRFYLESTRDQVFYSSPTKNVTVKMMGNPDTRYMPYFENDDVQILGLNCMSDPSSAGPKLTMFVVLPKERFGLQRLESKAIKFAELLTLMKQTAATRMAEVRIPKFKIDFEVDLAETLKSVGVRNIFNSTAADLSKINGHKNLYVSKAVHKAFVEVTEIGVEAAAASVVILSVGASLDRSPTKDFVADHPFLFAIVDTRKYIPLFVGKYVGN